MTNAPHPSQPDNQFLVISNRGDNSFTTTAANGSTIPSDSLSTFSLQSDGTLEFLQLAAAGGSFPRQFSLNAAGDLVAVGLQNDGTVVILERNVTSGLVGERVAIAEVGGQVTCVVWDE